MRTVWPPATKIAAQRRILIAGNWKMNGLRADGVRLACNLAERARINDVACELLLCPPATLLSLVGAAIVGSGIQLGGQDCHPAAAGPFTGSISAEMLRDAGCTHVIIGHSERRSAYGESDADVQAKTAAAWRAGLTAIVCVGETREERVSGRTIEAIIRQVSRSVPDGATADNLVIAYEPVWAIGSGQLPKHGEIGEAHAAIAANIPPATRILYGGSVNARNALDILRITDVGGALVGSASLCADDFWAVAKTFPPPIH